MSSDSNRVRVRRQLKFASLDDVVTHAEKLVASPDVTMLGKWTLGQLLGHLTLAINGSIDGISAKAPWFIRFLGPLIKRQVLRKMPAGFKLPKDAEAAFFPTEVTSAEGLQRFQAAVGRLQNARMTAKHPVLGRLSHEEWIQLHLRHAELHLSFADCE